MSQNVIKYAPKHTAGPTDGLKKKKKTEKQKKKKRRGGRGERRRKNSGGRRNMASWDLGIAGQVLGSKPGWLGLIS